MINVYICEDNNEQLDKIKNAVNNTIIIENYDMQIVTATSDPYEILENIESDASIGIYFLDVDLNADINGIQLAEKIRQYDSKGAIIFVTTHAEMSYLTFKYKIEALDFIIKDDFNIITQRVRECIIYAHEKLSEVNKKNDVFRIKTRDKIILVEYGKIISFETSDKHHKITLYTDTRQLEFYGNMKDTIKMLDDRFVRCHNSYIINKDYIQEIDKKNRLIFMTTGQKILASVRGIRGLIID